MRSKYYLLIICTIFGVSCDTSKNAIVERNHSTTKSISIHGTVNKIADTPVGSVIAIVSGDFVDAQDTFTMLFDDLTSTYSGSVEVPARGDGWSISIIVLNTTNKKIGQASSFVDKDMLDVDIPVSNGNVKITVNAGRDTVVCSNTLIHLHGSVVDSFSGIVYTGWDIGNTGYFLPATVDTQVFAPSYLISQFMCILRAEDEDGNVGFDTVMVSIDSLSSISNTYTKVRSTTMACLYFNGNNSECSFRGYYLYAENNYEIPCDSICMTSGFVGDTCFFVSIDKNVSATWKIAPYGTGPKIGNKEKVVFNGCHYFNSLMINKSSTVNNPNDGLDIDRSVRIVDVADNIKSSFYQDESEADWIIEKSAYNDSAFITPINGASIISLSDTTRCMTQEEIDAAILLSNKSLVPAAGIGSYVFHSGASVRLNGTGLLLRPSQGQCYLLISSHGNIARLILRYVSAQDASVLFDVYTPPVNGNGSVLLY